MLAGCHEDHQEVRCIQSGLVDSLPALASNHEKSDTRMILHAIHIDSIFGDKGVKGNILIRSSDVDVLIIAVYYFPQIKNTNELWIHAGSVSRTTNICRYIAVHEICQAFPPKTLHSFPHMQKRPLQQHTNLWHLYMIPKKNTKIMHGHINQLTVKLAGKPTDKVISLTKLPPSKQSCDQHIKRTFFVGNIWITSHVCYPELRTSEEHCWQKHQQLQPIMYILVQMPWIC